MSGPGSPGTASGRNTLRAALASCRGVVVGVGLMTAMTNVLALTGSFFMLEVYDRVLPSRSIPTLVGLSILALALYLFQGLLDILRARVLVRVGAFLDAALGPRVFDVVLRLPLKARAGADGMQPLRDLDQVRGFLSSVGPTTLFDLPWMPLYVAVCFLFHTWLGIAALTGAAILVVLTLFTEILTRAPARAAVEHATARLALAEAGLRNAEAVHAMGMRGPVAARWWEANQRYQESQRRTADVAGGFGALSRVFRMVFQSGVLALGAYLVTQQQATGGIIIASSILTSRALAPVEQAIAHWRGFVSARQSWRRLSQLFEVLPQTDAPLALPAPAATFAVEAVSAGPPATQRLTVQDVTFALKAGNGLGVIGPSASGKSSLARVLVGVWTPVRGKVRLDGAALEQWDSEALGRHVGYLPQDVELLEGSVAQNIGRFAPDADPEAVIAAARAAHVHDLILRLPAGYETGIGEGGVALSAGQRQRVALARALYGDPFLVVLDEPNSNLDGEGEQALTQAIAGVRRRGGVVVVVAHRASALAAVDLVLVMDEGRVQAFGPKEEVLAQAVRPPPGPPPAPPGPPRAPPAMLRAAAAPKPLKVVRGPKGGDA